MLSEEEVKKIKKHKAKFITTGKRGIIFDVSVIEHRRIFGRDELLIKPVSGAGKLWVRPHNLIHYLSKKSFVDKMTPK